MVATVVGADCRGGSTELGSIGHQVITGRWFTVFASLLVMAVSSTTYMFGSYSNGIKTSLGYNLTTLNLLGFFKDLGANIGVVSDLINETTPPWNNLNFTRTDYVLDGLMVLFLLFLPLAVVFREELYLWRAINQDLTDTSKVMVITEAPSPTTESNQPQLESSVHITKSEKESSCFSNIFKPPSRGEDYTILQALFSVDMLLLFAASTFSISGTLIAIDNLGQITKSLGYPSKSTSTFVSLVSIWNYLERVVASFAFEIFLTKYKFPRPLMLSLIMLVSSVGHLLIAFGVPSSLYLSSLIAGFCFGAQWPLIYAIISEIFGPKYCSTLMNMGGLASPLGSYILNIRVTGYLFDKEASKQGSQWTQGKA
ncbi:hypothetical protein K1719_023680 [Acacia pycnantha]|nr:hypothetical protein K1719_023680 [Acacia pycnantha]